MRLSWTKRLPTQDGYYWHRQSIACKGSIVQVVCSFVFCCGCRNCGASSSLGGEWYGPLEEPGGDAIENCPRERVEVTIPAFVPSSVNTYKKGWRANHRAKKSDREILGYYFMGSKRASGKRRVHALVTLSRGMRNRDPDNLLKSLLDGLKHAGMLVDDSKEFCEIGTIDVDRDPGLSKPSTTIILEDIV